MNYDSNSQSRFLGLLATAVLVCPQLQAQNSAPDRDNSEPARAGWTQVAMRLDPTTAIAPGETLIVTVAEDPYYNGRYQVRRGGYFILPNIGRIAVAGKTIEQAEAALQNVLLKSRLQKATVTIKRSSGS